MSTPARGTQLSDYLAAGIIEEILTLIIECNDRSRRRDRQCLMVSRAFFGSKIPARYARDAATSNCRRDGICGYFGYRRQRSNGDGIDIASIRTNGSQSELITL